VASLLQASQPLEKAIVGRARFIKGVPDIPANRNSHWPLQYPADNLTLGEDWVGEELETATLDLCAA
jgi:hypothetical protein